LNFLHGLLPPNFNKNEGLKTLRYWRYTLP
jgi:hypothetical protein